MAGVFILIVATWGRLGPVYSMQEFTSLQACQAAESVINHRMLPPNDMSVITRCVSKDTGQSE